MLNLNVCSSNRFLKMITLKGGGYMEVLFFLHPPPSLPSPSPFSPPNILSPSLLLSPFSLSFFSRLPPPFSLPLPCTPGLKEAVVLSRVCLCGARGHYLIGHFRSRATLEPTRVSRVETFLCFLETLVTRVRIRV